MSAWVSTRILVVALLVPVGFALTSCGKSVGNPSVSSESASSGSCAPGSVAGQIGGDPKCLRKGGPCQGRWESDYERYGFKCTKSNGKYELDTK